MTLRLDYRTLFRCQALATLLITQTAYLICNSALEMRCLDLFAH